MSRSATSKIAGQHYTETACNFTCLSCGKKFPARYPERRTSAGGNNLRAVYAWENFKSHMSACWAKKE
jgi:hypothetical protein